MTILRFDVEINRDEDEEVMQEILYNYFWIVSNRDNSTSSPMIFWTRRESVIVVYHTPSWVE